MDAILLIGGLAIGLAGLGLTALSIAHAGTDTGAGLLASGLIALVGGLILVGLAAILWQLLRIARLLGAASSLEKPGSIAQAVPPAAVAATAEVTVVAPVEIPVAAKETPQAEAVPPPERKLPAEAPRAPAPEPQVTASPAARELPSSWLASEAKERRPRRETERPLKVSSTFPADDLDQASPAGTPVAKKDVPVRAESTAANTPDVAPPRPPGQKTRSLLDRLWVSDRSADTTPPVEVEVPKPPPPPDSAPSIEDMISQKIFKSGVIEGMPYTLYIDGSIEAELSQGTVRFASLDELRAHLAKRNR